MIYFYRLMYFIFFVPGMKLLSVFNQKIAKGLALRQKNKSGVWPWLNYQKNSQPVWIHTSSMEFEYAKPVIRELKGRAPNTKIIVTFFSPSAEQACKNFPGVDFACPSPWDSPGILKEFINHHNPRALLLARTDTWPEMLYQCKKSRIPTLLFSSTFPMSSSRNHWSLRLFYRWVFSLLQQIFVVGADDFDTYKALGISQVTPQGDTRYDQVLFRLQNPKPIKSEFFPNDGVLTFIAGSTWPEDEKQICFAIKDLVKFNIKARFILVPHEPTVDHVKQLEKSLSGVNYTFYSQLTRDMQIGQVLIVDQIGILAELYALADIAFIGGSFKKNVHSVMESLACGCLTLVGPKHKNNREAIEFKSLDAVRVVSDFNEIEKQVREYVKILPIERLENKNRIKSLVKQKTGVSGKVVDWVVHSIPGGSGGTL